MIAAPVFFHKLTGVKFNKYMKIISSISAVVMILLPVYYFSNHLSPPIPISLVFEIVIWGVLGLSVYIAAVLFLGLFKAKIREKKLLLFFILGLFILFIPFFYFEDAFNYHFLIFKIALSAIHFFYFLFNFILLVFILKYIFRWENSLAAEEIPENFLVKYGITAREKEIIALIKKGKTNKQIARDLYIAAMTVKNHIHNIYQKTSAEGKIELIYMASKEEVPRTILEKILS